jgi:glucose/arabinose dehydrogenase
MRRIALIIAVVVLVAAAATFAVTRGPSPGTAGGSTPLPGTDAAPGASTPAADAAGDASVSGTAPAARAATTRPPSVSLSQVPGSYSQPLYVTAPPGDTTRLFIVEKTGTIRIVKDGAVLQQPFLDISAQVSRGSEQGLLSMAFHPRYASNGRFYVNYTNASGDTRVVRYRVSATDPDRAAASSARVLLRVGQPYGNHNGGQLQFGPDGRLWVGMGDGGSGGDPQRRAQDPRSRLGKMLRVNVNVSPARVGIYAKGLRNPWRFSFDRATGALWIGDVGQNTWEEIDYLRPGRPAGANFGWNAYEGAHVYDAAVAARLNRSSLTWPVSQYSHSVGYSVTGGYVYRGTAVPSLRGFYVFADYSGRVWAKRGPGANRYPLPGADRQLGQIASFGEDARGELYVVSLAGSVFRIVAP